MHQTTLTSAEWFALAVGVIFSIFLLLLLVMWIIGRFYVPSRYDWLKVMSHTEWKTALQLRGEMELLIGQDTAFASFGGDLRWAALFLYKA